MAQSSNQSPEDVRNAAKTTTKGDNPSTAGAGETGVKSSTPENALGHLNPSAPEDANVTPGSTTVK